MFSRISPKIPSGHWTTIASCQRWRTAQQVDVTQGRSAAKSSAYWWFRAGDTNARVLPPCLLAQGSAQSSAGLRRAGAGANQQSEVHRAISRPIGCAVHRQSPTGKPSSRRWRKAKARASGAPSELRTAGQPGGGPRAETIRRPRLQAAPPRINFTSAGPRTPAPVTPAPQATSCAGSTCPAGRAMPRQWVPQCPAQGDQSETATSRQPSRSPRPSGGCCNA